MIQSSLLHREKYIPKVV